LLAPGVEEPKKRRTPPLDWAGLLRRTFTLEASEVGRGLPRYVERDFARYLECGVLAHGFAWVRCERCQDEFLIAFSCKGRGVCPSSSTKRAQVTTVHRVEWVLPHVPYRQWTLSFPHRVRWVLLPVGAAARSAWPHAATGSTRGRARADNWRRRPMRSTSRRTSGSSDRAIRRCTSSTLPTGRWLMPSSRSSG
jgi:hypothetical protein